VISGKGFNEGVMRAKKSPVNGLTGTTGKKTGLIRQAELLEAKAVLSLVVSCAMPCLFLCHGGDPILARFHLKSGL
jgi:hypothetical protein